MSSCDTGNLTRRVRGHLSGGMHQLQIDADNTIYKLNGMVVQIQSASRTISAAAAEITHGNADIRNGTDAQVSSLVTVTQIMSDLTEAVQQSEESARMASQHAHSASQVAADCGRVVGDVADFRNRLHHGRRTKYVDASPFELLEGRLRPGDSASLATAVTPALFTS